MIVHVDQDFHEQGFRLSYLDYAHLHSKLNLNPLGNMTLLQLLAAASWHDHRRCPANHFSSMHS